MKSNNENETTKITTTRTTTNTKSTTTTITTTITTSTLMGCATIENNLFFVVNSRNYHNVEENF